MIQEIRYIFHFSPYNFSNTVFLSNIKWSQFLLQFISVMFFFFLCTDIMLRIVLQLLNVVLNLHVIILRITLLHFMYYTKHRFSLIVLFASFSSFFFCWRLSSITLKTLDKTCSILEINLRSLVAIGENSVFLPLRKQIFIYHILHVLPCFQFISELSVFFLLFFKFGLIWKKKPPEVFNKKMFWKILQNWQENTCVRAGLKFY